jgi:hypothetical protein
MRPKIAQVLTIAVALLVLGAVLYAWIRPAGLSPTAQWCASRYNSAGSPADTARIDLLTPPNSAPPMSCGVMRSTGRLKV